MPRIGNKSLLLFVALGNRLYNLSGHEQKCNKNDNAPSEPDRKACQKERAECVKLAPAVKKNDLRAVRSVSLQITELTDKPPLSAALRFFDILADRTAVNG